MTKKKMKFFTLVLEGDAYQAGYQLGSYFKEKKTLVAAMTSPFMGGEWLPADKLKKAMSLFEQYCPGTNQEIHGFADALDVPVEHVVYYYAYLQLAPCNCSQLIVRPEASVNHHGYLARNYEFGWEEEPILIESRITNQYQHIGFGCQFFGRFDGMNEHGLCIATSASRIKRNNLPLETVSQGEREYCTHTES